MGESLAGCVSIMLGYIVIALEGIAFLYNLKLFVQNSSQTLKLKVEGSKSKVSQFKWRRVENPTYETHSNDNYIHVRTRNRTIVLEPYYETHIVSNKEGVMVYAEAESAAKLFEKPSVADRESCACCDTDDSGCFICLSNCNFSYKAFSVQLHVFIFSSCQLISSFFPPEWHKENNLLAPTCILAVQVITALLSTISTFLNTENTKFCFCLCNVDLHYHKNGAYTRALSRHVKEAYDRRANSIDLSEDTSNAIPIVHPKYNRIHLVISGASTQETELLQTLLSDAHSQLYSKAFPNAPLHSSSLTTAQMNYLDEFYQEEIQITSQIASLVDMEQNQA